MQTTIAILGRQPGICRAELEAVFGSEAVRPVSNDAVELQVMPGQFAIERFGGTVKVAKLLNYIDSTKWQDLVAYVEKTLPGHLHYFPEGKIKLGLSLYGIAAKVNDVNKAGLRLKKLIKSHDKSVRVTPNTALELNTAQVQHNQLTGTLGLELVFVKDGNRTILAQTFDIQNIASYTVRDRGRPKRDARVGMLPPKLAQILINLACSNGAKQTVLDPFCGTGVVLQESLLLGHNAYGTDIDKRMISYSQENIDWFTHKFASLLVKNPGKSIIEQGDARKHIWQAFSVVAGETYLGEPLASLPSHAHLEEIIRGVNKLHVDFLQNIGQQLKKGQRLCLAVPAWRLKSTFKHLPCLDDLEKLGYTRLSFAHASNEELVYFREDQLVARELVVLVKK